MDLPACILVLRVRPPSAATPHNAAAHPHPFKAPPKMKTTGLKGKLFLHSSIFRSITLHKNLVAVRRYSAPEICLQDPTLLSQKSFHNDTSCQGGRCWPLDCLTASIFLRTEQSRRFHFPDSDQTTAEIQNLQRSS